MNREEEQFLIAQYLAQSPYGPSLPQPGGRVSEIPDYGLGPMTPTTRAGYPNDSLWAAQDTPADGLFAAIAPYLTDTHKERVRPVMQGLFAYGDMPAKAAVDVAMQPARAADAVVEAGQDPTLANVTNAGLQSALSIPTMRGVQAGMGALAAGYGIAGGRDMGLFDIGAQAQALTPDQQKRRQELQRRVDRANWRTGTERRQIEGELNTLREIEAEYAKRQNAGAQEEYSRAVKTAETARDDALARDRRFSETEMGKIWDTTGGWGPMAAGAGLGALSRAVNRGSGAMADYVAPGLIGGVTGAAANNIPLAYNAFMTEPDNPQKVAYESYARELPDNHPERQKWQDYASSLPAENPVRRAAAEELYDPTKAAERMFFGAVEGAAGGIAGSELARLPGRMIEGAARVPGRAATAYHESMLNADRARAARAGVMPPAGLQPHTPMPPGSPSGGSGALPPAGPVGGVPVPSRNPQPSPSPQPDQRRARFGADEKDEVLRRWASGNTSWTTKREQDYADYLTNLSTQLGVQPSAMVSARAARPKGSAWAIPATAAPLSFLGLDDEEPLGGLFQNDLN